MITISNSLFDVQGASKKDAVYGITISGKEDVVIENCKFTNQGYSSILNNGEGNLKVSNCTFECDNVYNPIEGSQKVDNGNVTVENCIFNGVPGNNYINFYQVAPNSEHIIANCEFAPSVDNNVIRLSNRESAPAIFTVKDCSYNFLDGEATDYTNFLLCQDYTSKSGKKQDFTGYIVILDGVTCGGQKLAAGVEPAKGGVYYVYQDGAGIITGQDNDPVIIFR